MGDGTAGPVALKLKQALLELQTGRANDQHGWVDRLF
jgi:branched-chain amino acid aminotransferase